jgi:hypothetical protein
MSVILATQEAEIRRIAVQSQPRQIVFETPSQKIPSGKRAGGVTQGEGPEFKPQNYKNKQASKQKKKNGDSGVPSPALLGGVLCPVLLSFGMWRPGAGRDLKQRAGVLCLLD